MQFSIKKRDGPARIGEFIKDNTIMITPNIFYLNTLRFKSPNFAEILLTNKKNKLKKPSIEFSEKILFERFDNKNKGTIITINHGLQLYNQSKKFVDFIINLKEKAGYQKAIYLPSVCEPANLALFAYIGIDLFDSTQAIIAARNQILFFEGGKYSVKELEEIPCNCPICIKIKKKTDEMKFEEILNHNYHTLNSQIKLVRNAIIRNELRNLVEKSVRADPNQTTILKYLDNNCYDFLEKRAPVASKSKIIATTKESSNRAEIIRFQKRIIERYKKPSSAKILLLLPCSAKKPYFLSKSHKFFREQIFSTENPFIVHELIITSPLGLVPRELELTYPAADYDIPVIGVWESYEKEMITNLLKNYLKKNKYEKIVAHIPKELLEFIKPIIKKPIVTCIDTPTSEKSLKKLNTVLNQIVKKYQKINIKERSKEEIKSIAYYQFGQKLGKKLLENVQIKGKYPNRKIFENNVQLGMITQERGLISLTLAGANKINNPNDYFVEIYDDFKLVGSVFAPGIKNADEKIRIGDDVIIIKNKKVHAVGVALMNGEEMKESTHGEAVKVRHRF